MRTAGSCLAVACVVGSLSLATVVLAGAPAKPAAVQKGEAVVASVTVTAKVMKINHETREVTLKAEDGQEYSFVADQAVENLAQVKTGDLVTATYTEALAYEVKKGGKAGAGAAVAAGAAPLGAKPAAIVGDSVTLTVAITAIDAKVPSITFKGPDGDTRTIKVKDPQKLQGVSVGDTVDITYAEALAMKVEKASRKQDAGKEK